MAKDKIRLADFSSGSGNLFSAVNRGSCAARALTSRALAALELVTMPFLIYLDTSVVLAQLLAEDRLMPS